MRRVLWLDLETTGLDETTGLSAILEVAVIVTDNRLKELHVYQNEIHQDEHFLEYMNDWCKKTHGASGLTDAVRASKKSLENVENDIIEIVQTYNTEDRIVLAGSSIHFDRKWIARFMPRLDRLLHYRMIDVSSFKEAMSIFLMPVYPKGEAKHRALDDIRGSLEEFKVYLALMEKGLGDI